MLQKPNMSCLSDLEKGYIIGIFLGDGTIRIDKKRKIYRVIIYLSPKDISIAKNVRKTLKKARINTIMYYSKSTNTLRLEINSKYFLKWLDKFVSRGKEKILIPSSLPFRKGIICGLIDSDGWINGKWVYIVSKNPTIISVVKDSLGMLNLKYYVIERFDRRYKSSYYVVKFKNLPEVFSLSMKCLATAPETAGQCAPNPPGYTGDGNGEKGLFGGSNCWDC